MVESFRSAGNVVVFEVTELPTTYVSETQLTAALDKSLLTASGEVAVVVRNRGPSGSYIDSVACAVHRW